MRDIDKYERNQYKMFPCIETVNLITFPVMLYLSSMPAENVVTSRDFSHVSKVCKSAGRSDQRVPAIMCWKHILYHPHAIGK